MFRTDMIIAIAATVLLIAVLFIVGNCREKRKKNSGVVFLIVATILLYVSIFVFLLLPLQWSYDRYGNRYNSDEDVLYYSEDGAVYRLVGEYWDDSYYYNVDDATETHELQHSFFTSNGYLVFDDSGSKYHQSTEHYDEYVDAEGDIVYDGMQIFDWTGTFYKDRNSDWVLWISSPYEDDDSAFINVFFTCIGIWGIFRMLKMIWDNHKKRLYEHIEGLFRYTFPAIFLFMLFFLKYVFAILFYCIFIAIMCTTLSRTLGLIRFLKEKDIGYLWYSDYVKKMDMFFPEGWKESQFKGYADPEEVKKIRRIFLQSSAIHLGLYSLAYFITYLTY